jgi:TonB family protein
MFRRSRLVLAALGAVAGLGACIDKDTAQAAVRSLQSGPPTPDTLPQMTNEQLPFTYPSALYAQKVQGNVTLRIYIDSTGAVRPDSTRVDSTSGYRELDSAAIAGSQALRFRPAKFGSRPGGVTILFPVFFRHPQGTALPGDTVLQQGPPQPPPSAPRSTQP